MKKLPSKSEYTVFLQLAQAIFTPAKYSLLVLSIILPLNRIDLVEKEGFGFSPAKPNTQMKQLKMMISMISFFIQQINLTGFKLS